MDPKIGDYIREHRGTYTRVAMREQLIAAGHDPGQVDEALAQSERAATEGMPGAEDKPTPHYWRWAIAIQLITLGVVTAWVAAGPDPHGYWSGVLIFLGATLFLSMGITGFAGRAVLPRTGLLVALLLPLASALLLGGICLGMMGRLGT